MLASESGQKIIILLSDGADGSPELIEEVLDELNRKNIIVYTIGFDGADSSYLSYIAQRCGGQFIQAASSEVLGTIYADIGRTMSNDYVLEFTASQEIQRLIGRSLRAVVDLEKMPEISILIDCDVLQADGGTRVASVSGGFVALHQAIAGLIKAERLTENPIREFVAAVSCDICNGEPVLDVDYEEDSTSQVDMNFVMTESGKIVEIQGTAEGEPFTEQQFGRLLDLGKQGIQTIIAKQKEALQC